MCTISNNCMLFQSNIKFISFIGMHKKVATPPEAVQRCRIAKVFPTISHINVAQDIRMVVIVFIHMRASLFRRDNDNLPNHFVNVCAMQNFLVTFLLNCISLCKFNCHLTQYHLTTRTIPFGLMLYQHQQQNNIMCNIWREDERGRKKQKIFSSKIKTC